MATSQDFIPTDAKPEVNKVYFKDGVKNLASNEDISTNVLGCVNDYEARFVGQRDEWDSDETGIWNLQDAFWRSGLNDSAVQSQKSKGANEPNEWERAKTGSTLLYRQVRQKASNGYSIQSSKDMPFKYDSISDDGFDQPEHTEERAKKLNLLAKWSMKNDSFNLKSIDFWTQIYKRGNVPVMVEWVQEMGKKKYSEPVFDEDGITIKEYEIKEIETATVNRPTLQLLPIESLYADTAIGNIQDQECVIISTVVSITEIIAGIRSGIYQEGILEDISKSNQWDGYSGGYDNENNKKENRGMTSQPTNSGTGQYLKREVFVNLPIDLDKETWDERENIPERYRVTMFGNQPSNSIIARIERNQEPDDSIPIEMIHANPDDTDLLYHISDYEVIRSNISTETTLIRQIIDNNTLVCKPPLIELEGMVKGNNRTFGPNARFIEEERGSLREFNIRDISQPTMQVLEYIKEDSNVANSIDKNMIGESFGARTTASEATTISSNSSRPNLVNIEYILEQFLGFYAKRLKVNWETYGRHDQIIQITDENEERVFIKPKGLEGDYDIIIDVVDDMKDSEVKAQRMMNGAQMFASIPELSQITDWNMVGTELAETIFGTSKFIKGANDADAAANAHRNILLMMNEGIPLSGMTPDMNLKRHLEIYKEERKRFVGSEEEYPNVDLLDQAIEQLEEAINAQPSGGQQQQSAGMPQAQAQLQQQLTSGALGGLQ